MSEFFWFDRDIIQKPCFSNPLCTVVMITLGCAMDEKNQTHGVTALLQPVKERNPGVWRALQMLERDEILTSDKARDCVEFNPKYVTCESPEGM